MPARCGQVGARPAMVLLADVNSNRREYLEALLADQYSVIAVADGESALAAAREHQPDLILSHGMMPGLDSFSLVQRIRADPQTSALPILLLSAASGEEAHVEGLEHGADDYLGKAFNPRELLARVKAQVDLARRQRALEEVLRRSAEELEMRVRERTAALERANQALQLSEKRLAAELADAKTLQGISTKLIPELSLDTLYSDILSAAMKLMRADAASIQMLDSDNTLKLLAWKNFHPDAAAFWQRVDANSASACGQALLSNHRILVADVESCDFMAGSQDLEELRRSGIRAVQSTPLMSRSGRPLGMISTHWRTPRVLVDGDFSLLDVLARQAAELIERSRAAEALRNALAEKEALLKEVHHRVKNNLQVITSLLEMQARQVRNDPEALTLFGEARNRVLSIATIHELLYRSGSFAAVDLADYARQIVPHVVAFYHAQSRVRVSVQGKNVALELERAVPFGLMLNELIANVCKHAFPEPRTGELRVRLHQDEQHLELQVSDTGRGQTPPSYSRDGSFGLQLVQTLAEQLGGTVGVSSGNGTSVVISIPRAHG